jgi:hypothetical protein
MIFAPFAYRQEVISVEPPLPKSATFIAFSGYTADASSYTMTQTLTAGNYFVVVHYVSNDISRTLSSVEFSGSTGTSNATISLGGYNRSGFVRISYINITGSTTYNIVANLSGTVLRAGIGLYRLNEVVSVVPNIESPGFASFNSGTSTRTQTSAGWGGGLGVIIMASTNTANATALYTTPNRETNITEDYDNIVESSAGFSSSNLYGVDSNNTETRVQFSNSDGQGGVVTVIWV